jgi:peptidoglycan/xylan/chitin deacetylase (PgdA/CDA1 family)
VLARWKGEACDTAPAGSRCDDRLPDSGAVELRVRNIKGCRPAGHSLRKHGPSRQKLAALTFDDGPGPYTGSIARKLSAHDVNATFFVVGRQVPGRGATLRGLLRRGDEIGNHGFSHRLLSADGGAARAELERTTASIRHRTGFTPCLFRAPYGAIGRSLLSIARRRNMLTIGWNVDPSDWSRPGARAIAANVVANTRSGSIILLHDGGGLRDQTVAAVPAIVHRLRLRGFRLVTVSELLGLAARYR